MIIIESGRAYYEWWVWLPRVVGAVKMEQDLFGESSVEEDSSSTSSSSSDDDDEEEQQVEGRAICASCTDNSDSLISIPAIIVPSARWWPTASSNSGYSLAW